MVDEHQVQTAQVILCFGWESRCGDGEGEGDLTGILVDVGSDNVQGAVEGWEADGAEVGAGRLGIDDEVLDEGVEGEFSSAGCEEGELRGDVAEDVAVETVLLALLAYDCCNATDESTVAV